MHQYQPLLQRFLPERIKSHRSSLHVTQEIMSERLRISTRSYCDLECGKYACSAATLMFFLLTLPNDDILQLCTDFRALVEQEDSHVVA